MTKAEFITKALAIMEIAASICASPGDELRDFDAETGQPDILVEYDGRFPSIRVRVFRAGWVPYKDTDFYMNACFSKSCGDCTINKADKLDECIEYLEELRNEVICNELE